MAGLAEVDVRDDELGVTIEWQGKRHTVEYVGIGHPVHTITDGHGRVATDAEVALAHVFAEAMRQLPRSRRSEAGLREVLVVLVSMASEDELEALAHTLEDDSRVEALEALARARREVQEQIASYTGEA